MNTPSAFNCFHCKAPFTLPDGPVGRGEACAQCGRDVRVCYNCRHYDASCYNECRESQAERVVDKDKANFCSYFSLGRDTQGKQGSSKDDILKKLEGLFKSQRSLRPQPKR